MKFTPRSEETRQFIIEKTAEVFNTKGFAGTSMSDLTEATKLTKGSIYGNFENKEEVALAVMEYMIAGRATIMKQYLSKVSSARGKLLALAALFSSRENHVFPEGGCPLLNIGTEVDDTHEPLRKKVSGAFGSWKKELEGILTEGISAKEFRKDTDVEQTALSIIALIEGSILLQKVMQKPGYQDAILRTIGQIVDQISAG